MDFVEARVAGRDDESGDTPGPMPANARAARQRGEQNRQDEIFREVRALTNDVVNVDDLVARELGESHGGRAR